MRQRDGRTDFIAALGCALAAAPIACFLLLQPAARAERVGVHYGLGAAPGGHLTGDLARKLDTDGHVGGRFYLGLRRPGIGVELSLAGTDATVRGADADISTFALAIEARPSIGLTHWLHLYVHGGPSYTWLGATAHPLGQFSGFGLVYGTGFELSLDHRLPSDWLFGISLWIDQSRQHLDLSSGRGELDGTIDLTLVGMGFSFGG